MSLALSPFGHVKKKGVFMKLWLLLGVFLSCSSAVAGDQVTCIEFVKGEYPYPSVAEAAKLCKGGVSASCIKYVKGEYPYPSVPEAAKLCKGGVEADCIQYVKGQFPYPSLAEAAQLCSGGSCE